MIDAQIQAYLERDIDRFVAFYSQDAKVIRDPEGAIIVEGRDQLRRVYGDLFAASPNLKVEIASRAIEGCYVTDDEVITGSRGSDQPVRARVRYRLEGDLIVEMLLTPL